MLLPSFVVLFACFQKISCEWIEGEDVGTFWHYTDIHVDLYNRIENTSDIWGTYYSNASPLLAFNAIEMGNDMSYAENKPDFVIYGGGTASLSQSDKESDVWKSLKFVAHHMKQAFDSTDVPVFPILGKEDFYPTGKMPIDPDGEPRTYWCTQLAEQPTLWEEWIENAFETVSQQSELPMNNFPEGCYHSMVLGKNPKLLLLGLNGLVWDRSNVQTNESVEDPLNQFLWIETSLKWARDQKAKVFIVTHMPPGSHELTPSTSLQFYKSYNDRLINYIREYSDVVSAVLAGYEHLDAFRVILDNSYHPVNTIFLTPSVDPKEITSVGSFNPRIRQYKYSRRTGQILDYRQFWLNLSQPHPSWTVEYVATEEYGVLNLSASTLANLLDTFTSEDDPNGKWNAYWRHQLGGRPHKVDGECPKAESQCRCRNVCSMRHLDTTELQKCREICKEDKPRLPTIHDLQNPSSPSNDSVSVIVGSIFGVLAVLLLGGGVGYLIYRKTRRDMVTYA